MDLRVRWHTFYKCIVFCVLHCPPRFFLSPSLRMRRAFHRSVSFCAVRVLPPCCLALLRVCLWRYDLGVTVREMAGHSHVVEDVVFASAKMLRLLHGHKQAPAPLPSGLLVNNKSSSTSSFTSRILSCFFSFLSLSLPLSLFHPCRVFVFFFFQHPSRNPLACSLRQEGRQKEGSGSTSLCCSLL